MKTISRYCFIFPILFFFFQGIGGAQSPIGSDSFQQVRLPETRNDSVFIFDDTTAEMGWSVNAGNTAWYGDYFPLFSNTSGLLKSFDVYFYYNPHGSNQHLSIDVFNSNYGLVGSTALFMQTAGLWQSVPADNIPFSGPFYAMVKWSNVPVNTAYLGLDTDGHYASQDFERYYDGTVFQQLSDPNLAGSPPGVFLIHPHAFLNPLSINEEPLVFDPVQVYPNPAKDFIEISSEKPITSLEIFDLLGKIQISKPGINTPKCRIDLSFVPEGMYLLSLRTKEGNYIRKFSVHK